MSTWSGCEGEYSSARQLFPPSPPTLCLGKSKQDSGLHAQSSAQQRTRTGNTSGCLQGTSKLLCVIFVFPSLFTPSVGPLARMNHLSGFPSLTLSPASTHSGGDVCFVQTSRMTEAVSIFGLKSQEVTLLVGGLLGRLG